MQVLSHHLTSIKKRNISSKQITSCENITPYRRSFANLIHRERNWNIARGRIDRVMTQRKKSLRSHSPSATPSLVSQLRSRSSERERSSSLSSSVGVWGAVCGCVGVSEGWPKGGYMWLSRSSGWGAEAGLKAAPSRSTEALLMLSTSLGDLCCNSML